MVSTTAKNLFTPGKTLQKALSVLLVLMALNGSGYAQREADAMKFGGCSNNQICLCPVGGQGWTLQLQLAKLCNTLA